MNNFGQVEKRQTTGGIRVAIGCSGAPRSLWVTNGGSSPPLSTTLSPRSAGFVKGPARRTSRASDGILEPGRGDVTQRACVAAGETAKMGYWCNGSTEVSAKTMEAAEKSERVQIPHTPKISSASASWKMQPKRDEAGWSITYLETIFEGSNPSALTTWIAKSSNGRYQERLAPSLAGSNPAAIPNFGSLCGCAASGASKSMNTAAASWASGSIRSCRPFSPPQHGVQREAATGLWVAF